MKRTLFVGLVLACLAGLGPIPAARGDDAALLSRVTPAPDVLVILDTSQSMTWYNKDGATVGDEFCYPGSLCPPPDLKTLPSLTSRMWMAKFILSNVVTSFGDQIDFGLASYAQGTAATNVKVIGPPPRSWYYAEGWCKTPYCWWYGFTIGNRNYLQPWAFDLRVPQAGLGGPANPADPAGYDPATFRPNSPSFTVTWQLQAGTNPTKALVAAARPPRASRPPTTHSENRCRYREYYSYDQTTWTPYGGTWDTGVGGGCPASSTVTSGDTYVLAVTISWTCTFAYRKTYDDPKPYVYNCTRYNNGVATGSTTASWQDDQGPSYSWVESSSAAWWHHSVSLGQVSITVVDDPGDPGDPGAPAYYQWTYHYEAVCKANCKNAGKFWQWTWSSPWFPDDAVCKAGQVNDPYADPPAMGLPACGSPWRNGSNQVVWSPSATGAWGVPYDAEYKWQGNNYALTTDNSCSGAQVLVDVGSGTRDAIKNYLGTGIDPTKELHAANQSTPLGGALDTALTYFTTPDGVVQTDTQKTCRKHYVLLITDGGESCLIDLTVPGQKAAALAAVPGLPGGVQTYVVGIDQGGLSADEKKVMADIAAKGGTGSYYKASTPQALLDALLSIIGSILSQQYTFVPPVVPSLRTQDNLMLVQGSFVTPVVPPADPNTPLWQGVLKAFPLTSQGTVAITGLKVTAPPLWEAGALLANKPESTRVIKTVVGGSLTDFKDTPPNPALETALSLTLDVNGSGGPPDSADAQQVVASVRGPSPGNKGFLGDIFHSVPVIVGPPSSLYVDRTFDPMSPSQLLSLTAAPDTYAAYRAGAAGTRQRLAVVGANDGMLHALNAGTFTSGQYNTGDGTEQWAFIPPQLLPKLQYLAVNQGHQYYVDATPRVADVWLDLNNDGVKDTNGNEWRTVLIGGFRQGGTGLYALDITDTANPPRFLWTYATTGQSWSEPAFGKVKLQIGGRLVDRWVAFVGDGYDPAGTNGRMVHVIDIQTGKPLWQYPTASSVAASPLAVDVNSDGYVDRVYVGTVGGDFLRLDVSAVGQHGSGDVDPANGVMVDNWSGGVFFTPGAAVQPQPFYTKGVATVDPQGNLWLFFGSGDRTDPLLVPSTPNRIYGIKDPYAGTAIPALTEADLTDMTTTNTLSASAVTGSGWFIVLRSGEKEWAETALVFNQQVFFTTFTPGSTGCGDVGSGAIYMVFYLTGGGVVDTAAFLSSPPTASSRVYQVNAGATTRPVITTGNLGSAAVIYLANSNMLTLTPTFSAPGIIRSTVYWRRVP